MSLITLLPHQLEHVNSIKECLGTHRIAVDTSPTGAGKTFTSLYQANDSGLPLFTIAPKSISLVWEKLTKQYAILTHSIFSYDIVSHRKIIIREPVFLVIDEFHFIKNASKRYQSILRLLRNLAPQSKVLFLSATPYDKEAHLSQMSALFRSVTDIGEFKDVIFAMEYSLPVSLTVTNGFYQYEMEDQVVYKHGVETLHTINRLLSRKEPPPPSLIAKLIGAGTRDTHWGSMDTVIKVANRILTESPTTKVIVIGKFLEQLDYIAESLDEFGVVQLDGRTTNRMQILEQFQAPSIEIRVIITSAQVGGVGINLDDQDGGFPRHMLLMPSYECIDMIQCIGRIYRSNTKSNANVTVVYNNEIACPIQKCLETKSKVIQEISTKSLIPDLADFDEYREATEIREFK